VDGDTTAVNTSGTADDDNDGDAGGEDAGGAEDNLVQEGRISEAEATSSPIKDPIRKSHE